MIEKDRLEELIKQKATIYTWSDRAAYEYFGYKMTFDEKVFEIHLQESDEVVSSIGNSYVLYSSEHPIMALYSGLILNSLYESKWEMEFQDITRKQTMSLPTYTEYKKTNKFVYGKPLIGDECYAEIIMESLPTNTINIYHNNELVFNAKNNEENYVKACQVCKDIFLGEIGCQKK